MQLSLLSSETAPSLLGVGEVPHYVIINDERLEEELKVHLLRYLSLLFCYFAVGKHDFERSSQVCQQLPSKLQREYIEAFLCSRIVGVVPTNHKDSQILYFP